MEKVNPYGKKIRKFFVSLGKATFTRDGDPFLPYIYLFIFLCLVMVMFVMKLEGSEYLSDALILGALNFVAIWIAIIEGGRRIEKFIDKRNGKGKEVKDDVA